MQAIPQNRLSQPYARSNNFHGPKRQLLGNQAGHAPPSWRTNGPVPVPQGGKGRGVPTDVGSRIFLSRLPIDVAEKDVEVSTTIVFRRLSPQRTDFLYDVGIIQEDSWAIERFVPDLQLAGAIKGHGSGYVSAPWRCSSC